MTVDRFCSLAATLTRQSRNLKEFERTAPKMAKEKDYARPITAASVATAAGVGAYALLRKRAPLSSSASPGLRAAREAAEAGGFARVHVHTGTGPIGKIQKIAQEIMNPADVHVHSREGVAYTTGRKFKGAAFDPYDTERLAPKVAVGAENKTAKNINRSKIHEYKEATRAGLVMPHTAPLGAPSSLPKDYIAKFNTGARSQGVVTREMIQGYKPDEPKLVAFKKFQKEVYSKIKDVDRRSIVETAHPGYKHWMTEEAILRPQNFVRQKKIDITHEVRVHTLDGKSLGISSGRYKNVDRAIRRDAQLAAEVKLQNVHPRLKQNMLALDMARDTKGNWHVIETNPGPMSGFLTTTKPDVRGPYQLYKRITGRNAKPVAVAGAVGTATAAGTASAMAFPRRDKR